MGHIPVIDPNPRRGETVELSPDRKIRYRERSTVEQVNSDLKDNYGARHVRVKGQLFRNYFIVLRVIVFCVIMSNSFLFGKYEQDYSLIERMETCY